MLKVITLSFWSRTKPECIVFKYAAFLVELKKFILKFWGIWYLIWLTILVIIIFFFVIHFTGYIFRGNLCEQLGSCSHKSTSLSDATVSAFSWAAECSSLSLKVTRTRTPYVQQPILKWLLRALLFFDSKLISYCKLLKTKLELMKEENSLRITC